MADTGTLVLLAVCSSAALCVAGAGLLILTRPGSADGGDGPVDTGSGYRRAAATWFISYPACCKNSPNYDPDADKTECEDNSGCRWMGQFAGTSGTKSYDWVKNTNIASFFELGQTADSWASKWKNKKLRLRHPTTKRTMDVTILDRCADSDCRGCCTSNASKHGGFLVDLEWHTARRFWGSDSFEGLAPIDFKVL